MRTLNKAILIGNLGADPDLRSANSGNVIVNNVIAYSAQRGVTIASGGAGAARCHRLVWSLDARPA